MNINQKIFKAYDIRGIYGEDFDEDFAYRLGLAYVKMRKKETGSEKIKIVIAKDMRLSSDSLHKALSKGLLAGGADVYDIGLNSTPTFYFAVAFYNYDGGIIVSASHNPAKYNGFKLVRDKALPIGEETGLEYLKSLVLSPDLKEAENKGNFKKLKDVLETQIQYDLDFVDKTKIKPLKVVVDAANSMGATFCKELFKYIPAELIELNFELDGTFPNHEADPLKKENLEQLKDEVIKEKADLGIATDGDGDRVFFMDEKGQAISQAIIRGLLAKIFLEDKPGAKIAYDIRPGKITEDLIIENGGTPIVTRVGHSLIKQQAINEGAYFAGESSGHFFLNMDIGCFEVPVIVILKLLKYFSQSNEAISKQIEPYNIYFHSGEINSLVSDKEKVLEAIKEKYNNGEINTIDGVSVKYQDYWFNVRASNTEDKVRLNLEARDKETMEEKTQEVLDIIKSR
ncbi:phosphomannomutase/phosphoglucomutase [Patescibacteria group bacterium]|nr:phosphomannomutase/phosphoglucomutase [Patescibacteria group bacterium]